MIAQTFYLIILIIWMVMIGLTAWEKGPTNFLKYIFTTAKIPSQNRFQRSFLSFLVVQEKEQKSYFYALSFLMCTILGLMFWPELIILRLMTFSAASLLFCYSFFSYLKLFPKQTKIWQIESYLLLLITTFIFYLINYMNLITPLTEETVIFTFALGIIIITFSSFYLLKLLSYIVQNNFAHTVQVIAEFALNIFYEGLLVGTSLIGVLGGETKVTEFIAKLPSTHIGDHLVALSYYGLSDFFGDPINTIQNVQSYPTIILYIHLLSLLFGASYTWIFLANLISIDNN
ncbi:hypothetical protein ACVQ8P_00485 [Dellaglioa sp. BT-FLS60]